MCANDSFPPALKINIRQAAKSEVLRNEHLVIVTDSSLLHSMSVGQFKGDAESIFVGTSDGKIKDLIVEHDGNEEVRLVGCSSATVISKNEMILNHIRQLYTETFQKSKGYAVTMMDSLRIRKSWSL